MGKKLFDQVNLDNVSLNFSEEINSVERNDIAIIGMAARLPGAHDLYEFWNNTILKKECSRTLSDTRKKDITDFIKYKKIEYRHNEYARIAYLDEIDKFDYNFFNLSPKESSLIDPNQRIFLEVVWNAIEDAGYCGDKISGTKTGIYVGIRADDFYNYKNLILGVEPEAATSAFVGNMTSIIPSRISYMFDLKGPSITVDTSCSSSLVALHLACQAIKMNECDMTIVGGVRLNILPLKIKEKLGIESDNGLAKVFDDNADGTGVGEGAIAILLKPLNKAIRDNDNIYAVIKGSYINHDGKSTQLTAPNAIAQEELLLKAWEDSGVDPESITYIETHGTGTKLGDPIEIEGIKKAFSRYTKRKQFCAIASIKSNIGHLDTLAGMAGMVQAIMALKTKKLPPNFHFNNPNKKIDFENSPVYITDNAIDWDVTDESRKCGVSSFGFNGTNCHIILEEVSNYYSNNSKKNPVDKINMLTISAKSLYSLNEYIKEYKNFLSKRLPADQLSFDNENKLNLENMCYVSATGRNHFEHRVIILFNDYNDLKKKIELILEKSITIELSIDDIYYGYCKQVKDNLKNANENALTKKRADEYGLEAHKAIESFIEKNENDKKIAIEICKLYAKGAHINWEKLYKHKKLKKISIPQYQFEKKRCWLDIPSVTPAKTNENFYYNCVWQESKKIKKQEIIKDNDTVIIFKDNFGFDEDIIKEMRKKCEVKLIEVKIIQEHSFINENDNSYVIGSHQDCYDRLFNELKENKRIKIVHVTSIKKNNESFSLDHLNDNLNHGLYSLFFLSKSILNNKIKDSIDLIFITNYAYKITNDQIKLNPESAMISGFGKSMRWEISQLRCRFVDIDNNTSSETIVNEIFNLNYDFKVAYRSNNRYVENLSETDLSDKRKSFEVKNDGVYLVIGGVGGIGLEVSKYIAKQNKVNFVFINRSKFPDQMEWDTLINKNEDRNNIKKINKIKEIVKHGSHIDFFNADISDFEKIKNVINKTRIKYGKINGIIHSAGTNDGSLIENETIETFKSKLSSKVKGVFILDELTKDDNLDFFIMFSSVITLIGGVESCGYITANTFLDYFSGYRNLNRKNTSTINWPVWSDIGMLAGVEIDKNKDKEAFDHITSSEAMEKLDTIWGKDIEQLIIGRMNFGSPVYTLGNYLPFQLSEELNFQVKGNLRENEDQKLFTQSKSMHLIGNMDIDKIEETILYLWREKLGYSEININDNFFDIGGDSIMITSIHEKIDKEFPGKVTIADLFLYPTIKELADYIKGEEKSFEKISGNISVNHNEEEIEDKITEILEKYSSLEDVEQSDEVIKSGKKD